MGEYESEVVKTRSGNILCTLFRDKTKINGKECLWNYKDLNQNCIDKADGKRSTEEQGNLGHNNGEEVFMQGSEAGDVIRNPQIRYFLPAILPNTQSKLLSNAEMGRSDRSFQNYSRKPQVFRSNGSLKFELECETPGQPRKPNKSRKGISRKKPNRCDIPSFVMEPNMRNVLGMQIAKLAVKLAPPDEGINKSKAFYENVNSIPLRRVEKTKDTLRSQLLKSSVQVPPPAPGFVSSTKFQPVRESKKCESRSRRSADEQIFQERESADLKGRRKRGANMARTLQRLFTPRRLLRTVPVPGLPGAVPNFVIGRPPLKSKGKKNKAR